VPVKSYEVNIEKLVHGGQGIGTLDNGKKALVWGVLPGEKVRFRVTKRRSDFVEGVVEEILEPSAERIESKDELYLSTSPWQIMSYDLENEYKKDILNETLQRAGVEYGEEIQFIAPKQLWQYRNKMEYSFWGDDDGLHIALFNRGTHQKQVVTGSSIARPEIDETANKLCEILNDYKVRAGDLKSVIIRCDQKGECVVAIFTRNKQLPKIDELAGLCKGVIVAYSNPKSPASLRTEDLYKYGDISLSDNIINTEIRYDVFSFFQVNLPIFCTALEQISKAVGDSPAIDMFSGVGAIGLALPNTNMLIESEASNVVWAKKNTGVPRTAQVIHTSSERALEYIDDEHILIVDPPRAGLHKDLVDRINEVKPPKIIYLSCNPSTQARDLAALQKSYEIESLSGYNFFPRTPHIESLAILKLK
jgi:23S rRNA (uracil1939-C5)-methyltransferase